MATIDKFFTLLEKDGSIPKNDQIIDEKKSVTAQHAEIAQTFESGQLVITKLYLPDDNNWYETKDENTPDSTIKLDIYPSRLNHYFFAKVNSQGSHVIDIAKNVYLYGNSILSNIASLINTNEIDDVNLFIGSTTIITPGAKLIGFHKIQYFEENYDAIKNNPNIEEFAKDKILSFYQ